MKGRTLGILLVAFLLGCTSAESVYKKAERALARGDFLEAFNLYRSVAATGGDAYAAKALFMLAQMERGIFLNPEGAVEYCFRLSSEYPATQEAAKAKFLLAEIYSQDLGDVEKAVKVLESLEGLPLSMQERKERKLLSLYILQGRTREASMIAQAILKGGEGLDLTQLLLFAELFRDAGDLQRAEELYNRVIKEGRGEIVQRALYGKAKTLEDRGRLKEALRLLVDLRHAGYKSQLLAIDIRHIRRRIREEGS